MQSSLSSHLDYALKVYETGQSMYSLEVLKAVLMHDASNARAFDFFCDIAYNSKHSKSRLFKFLKRLEAYALTVFSKYKSSNEYHIFLRALAIAPYSKTVSKLFLRFACKRNLETVQVGLLKHLMRIEPENSKHPLQLAKILLANNNDKAALDVAQKALDSFPENLEFITIVHQASFLGS